MKKVLVIAYYYPPLADVGGNRTVRFVKNMGIYGWTPHVLTVRNPDANYCRIGNERPPENIPITRAFSIFNSNKIFGKINGVLFRIRKLFPLFKIDTRIQEILEIPDPLHGWIIPAYLSGKRILECEQYDLIYASVSPLGGGLIANWLSAKYKIPYIVDARDPISVKIAGKKPSTFREKCIDKCENVIIKNCSKFITTSNATAYAYKKYYPNHINKICRIYNSYDEVTFKEQNINETLLGKEMFRIIYIGHSYADTLDVSPFFIALREFISEENIKPSDIIFWIIGSRKADFEKIVDRNGLKEVVKFIDWMSKEEMFFYLRTSDLFLIRNPYKTNIGAKLFNGLAVDIPILSLDENEDVEYLIKKYAREYLLLNNANIIEIKSYLKKLYYSNKDSSVKPYNKNFILKFNGVNLTEELCNLFNEVIERDEMYDKIIM